MLRQSIPPAPNPPPSLPRATAGHLALSVRGWGICRCSAAREPGICQPPDHSPGFDTHAVSYQNITKQKVLQEKSSLAHLSRIGINAEGCNFTCVYAFLHCLSSQNYIAKLELSMWINVFWLLNQISVDIIWGTSFHIYKTIHNIRYSALLILMSIINFISILKL